MIEISLNNVMKSFGGNPVLQGVDLEVYQRERVALLGQNGAGKTTLFQIITGQAEPDEGTRAVRKSASIGMLAQLPEIPAATTVEALLMSVFEGIWEIKAQLEQIEALMQEPDQATEAVLAQYGRLQEAYEHRGGYRVAEMVERVCQGLAIETEWFEKDFAALSGGEQTRLMLARLLLQGPDILLLDEPTNHLDIAALEWLEEFLNQFPGTVVVISHDRYFLDRVVNRVVELVNGRAESYRGNFSAYLQLKEERYQSQLKQYESEQKKVRQLEAAAKRMHEWAKIADNGSMHRRAFSIEKRAERLAQTERPERVESMRTLFSEQFFSSQEVMVAEALVFAYDRVPIIDQASFRVHKGDRLAICGDNGSGKSTLLRLLLGELEPNSGRVRVGPSIRYAYLPQVVTFSEPSRSVLDTVRHELRESEFAARRLLAQYRFGATAVAKQVANLSGGEQSRLKLCLLMQDDLNLLVLDEPTNHLDILSRQWLEEALRQFGGTMVFVSHDRYFLKRFATRVAELNNGTLHLYDGGYEDYRTARRKEAAIPLKPSLPVRTATRESRQGGVRQPGPVAMAAIEAKIQTAERELADLEREMAEVSHDYSRLDQAYQRKIVLEQELEILYQQWLGCHGETEA